MWTSCDEGWDSEEFFDSAECLPVEESDWCNVVSFSTEEYAVWLSEPQSVKHRRKLFLHRMGLSEWGSLVSSSSEDHLKIDGDSTHIPGIQRLTGTSEEAVSSASDCMEDDRICSRNEVESLGNSVITDRVHLITELLEDSEMKREKRRNESSLWKTLLGKINSKRSILKPRAPSPETRKIPALRRVNAHHNKKRLLELSALYSGQDIQAHKGLICTMKFSPDGQYLSTGGEDGIVCIWRVMSADASSEEMYGGSEINSKVKSINHRASILKPDKIFWIDESPVQVFRGHTGDILDLAWSSSDLRLLSSSKDNTVRLWQVGRDVCQDVFHHNNYVTCVQFNPVNDDHFISGSIDGKARVWSVSTRRVVDWADVRDVITAICYRHHGKGFAIGTIAGACHFYKTTGTHMQRDVMISILARRKRNSGNRITSIQFSNDSPGRVFISSQDSKLRVFEGNNIIYEYKGPRKSGSQMSPSPSFSLTKKHMVSVGEDSRVYLWNQSDGSTKSIPSFEYFFSEGASVAVPWSGNTTVKATSIITRNHCRKEQERFSPVKWFSQDSQCRTWPEELLDAARAGDEKGTPPIGGTCGLVFVTGSKDGRIRTYHNYGLPVRL